MAVGLRACDLGRAGHAAAAAAIFRDHGAEDRFHPFGPQPADHVGRPAGRERHDQPDDAIGVGVSRQRRKRPGGEGGEAGRDEVSSVHVLPRVVSDGQAMFVGTDAFVNRSGLRHQVIASILARSSGVASGMMPNQALKAGRA